MNIKTKPLFIAAAISIVLNNNALAFSLVVDAGTTVNGETIDSTDSSGIPNEQYVYGTANDTTVNADNGQYIEDGGVANNTTVLSGGVLAVYSGGTSNSALVNTGSILMLDAGATINDTTVYGNLQNEGGTDVNTVLKSGSVYNMTGSATAEGSPSLSVGTIMETGSHADISSNSEADSWQIAGEVDVRRNGPNIEVDPLFKDTVINEGGIVNLNYSAEMDNTTVNTGGRIHVTSTDSNLYSTINNTFVNGGAVDVDMNGIANDTMINAGALSIDAGGVSNNTTVNSSSATMMNVGGTDNNTLVNAGGTYTAQGSLVDGVIARSNDTVIAQGASATLYESAEANRWNIQGAVNVEDDTAAINNSTVNGGELWIDSGTAAGTVVNSGEMVNASGHDVDTLVNGGNYYLGGADAATSSNLTINAGAYANINSGTVTNATIDGTMFVSPNSYAPDTTSTLQGDIAVNDGGKLTITAGADTANADTTISDSGAVFLSSNSADIDTYNYTLGATTLNGGSIVFDQVGGGSSQAGYSNLTLDSLDGAGSFYMNTDLADLQGDFLNVTGEANGDFNVYVADTGVSPTSDASLQIIQTGGGDADFTLANNGNVVDVGTYEYRLISDGKGGWALTPDAQPVPPTPPAPPEPTPPAPPAPTPPEPTPPVPPAPVNPTITPSTAAVLSMATVDPLIFQSELSSVRSRLDEVRSFSHDTNVWAHYTTNRYNVSDSAGADYDMHMNGVTIGADKSAESEHGVTTRGAFFSYSHSDVDFNRGGDGNVDSYSIGAYASYLHDSGFYLDGVIKANRFENDVNGQMTSGAAADGYYNTTGLGANIQGGKYFYYGESYIAPYAAITGFTSNSNDYTLSNGMRAHVGSQRSVIGEAGVSVGHKFNVQSAIIQPFAKIAVTQEFIDDNAVKVNDDNFTNDLSGTRGVYQLGINARLNKSLTVRADASYAEGNQVEVPWTANLGISYSFK